MKLTSSSVPKADFQQISCHSPVTCLTTNQQCETVIPECEKIAKLPVWNAGNRKWCQEGGGGDEFWRMRNSSFFKTMFWKCGSFFAFHNQHFTLLVGSLPGYTHRYDHVNEALKLQTKGGEHNDDLFRLLLLFYSPVIGYRVVCVALL